MMRIGVFIAGIMLWNTTVYSQVLFGEVWIDGWGDESQGKGVERVEIVNYGDRDRDLSGWSLESTSGALVSTSPPERWFFSTGTVIKATSRMTIYWNASGEDSSTMLYTGSGINLLDNTAGDLALVSPEGIEHYLQWGAAGQGLEVAAVAAGKWTAGEFLESFGEGGCCEAWGYLYLFDTSGGETGWVLIQVIDSAVMDQTWGSLKVDFLRR